MEQSNIGQANAAPADFSLAEVRGIVKDLLAPRAWIYWTDFLASLFAGSACFLLLRLGVPRWNAGLAAKALVGVALYAATCVLFYRAVLFVHELVHMRAGTFKAFRFVWNLLCGIPFLVPTFTYYTHVDHHMRSHFGTQHDGEYIPLASQRPIQMLLYLLQPFVIPILVVLRFLVLTPPCWFSPRLRRWAHQRASSLVMDPSYIRPLPPPKTLRVFRWQETACFLLLLGAAIQVSLGTMKVAFVVQSYFVAVGVLMLNNVRTLGAHRYVSGGEEMTFVEQLLDSINYPRFSLTTPLWAPVGLRYHGAASPLPFAALSQHGRGASPAHAAVAREFALSTNDLPESVAGDSPVVAMRRRTRVRGEAAGHSDRRHHRERALLARCRRRPRPRADWRRVSHTA